MELRGDAQEERRSGGSKPESLRVPRSRHGAVECFGQSRSRGIRTTGDSRVQPHRETTNCMFVSWFLFMVYSHHADSSGPVLTTSAVGFDKHTRDSLSRDLRSWPREQWSSKPVRRGGDPVG